MLTIVIPPLPPTPFHPYQNRKTDVNCVGGRSANLWSRKLIANYTPPLHRYRPSVLKSPGINIYMALQTNILVSCSDCTDATGVTKAKQLEFALKVGPGVFAVYLSHSLVALNRSSKTNFG